MNTYQHILKRLKDHYRRRRIVESALLALGGALLVYGVAAFTLDHTGYAEAIAAVTALALFFGRYLQLQLHRLSDRDIATYLNRHFVQLQDSTDLLMVPPEELGPLQQVQRRRLITAFEDAAKQIEWPQQWRLSLLALGFGLIVFWSLRLIPQPGDLRSLRVATTAADTISGVISTAVPAELEDFAISVNPPAYTGLRARSSKDFNLKIPEDSRVSWRLSFSGDPEAVRMIFSNGDSTLLSRDAGTFSLNKAGLQSGYYSFSWRDRGNLKSSDFYKLEIIEDQAPKVAIDDQEQFVEFDWREEIEVTLQSSLSDDYGLTEAYVVATVSKGSGESVKFREERLPFVRPRAISGKRTAASLQINTKKLGMEPGDELYYYVEAWDNHNPQRQSNRTETYFIQIRDTSTQMISFEGGLGVDLMPEYFRSQRQIIIDSEKLLAEQKAIEKKEFDDRSNTLAYDQKVLRLRYGQFLGEEFESGITNETQMEEEAAPEGEEDVLKKYGHAHDTDNEHNLVEEHEHEHEHDENPNPEENEESPLEAFAHIHDNMEEATFFIQSVKTKLRAALSMMWDAELHLRMNDPAQSLPYQYKILKLLKEISQDSRIYVHRTGFDAPPIKEEKRLTGELDEINSSRTSYLRSDQEAYPAVRQSLPLVETLLRIRPEQLDSDQKELLLAAGNELAAAAIEKPDVYLNRLSTLRAVLDGELTAENLRAVREAFWMLLPTLPRSAGNRENAGHSLQDAFIQQLKARTNR
ncbi:hypothetical protein [Flavilitoribacter nigricans]|uniref:DUF4175 domain-containing protein n=1 Tax=Flavilitoribacter nigricans (strain ATCC 23147 / DSM 23189 / NBRC 102662 / NCIMB 1420 / SS-2) TaxID=1122177 RepID=A0A2D0NEP1_FLAN2|nr:hypothetical protein [Flavilitoribacter nigricans]PHN06649.1 hypothetical protein CRP01_10155 [Flavilitoribacter nigricans DSM 23189 = NBRC 102662]